MQRVVTVPWTPISVYGITTSCSRLFQLFFSSIISAPRLTTFHYAAYRRCDYSLVEINYVIILRIIVVLWNVLTFFFFCTLANINVLNLIYGVCYPLTCYLNTQVVIKCMKCLVRKWYKYLIFCKKKKNKINAGTGI